MELFYAQVFNLLYILIHIKYIFLTTNNTFNFNFKTQVVHLEQYSIKGITIMGTFSANFIKVRFKTV